MVISRTRSRCFLFLLRGRNDFYRILIFGYNNQLQQQQRSFLHVGILNGFFVSWTIFMSERSHSRTPPPDRRPARGIRGGKAARRKREAYLRHQEAQGFDRRSVGIIHSGGLARPLYTPCTWEPESTTDEEGETAVFVDPEGLQQNLVDIVDLEAPAPLLPLSRPTPETVLLKARPKGPKQPIILHQQSLQVQSSPIILHLPFKVLLVYVHHPHRVQQAVSRNHLQLPRSLSGLRFQRLQLPRSLSGLRFQRLQHQRLQFRKLLFRRLRLRWLILQQQLQRHHRNVLQ